MLVLAMFIFIDLPIFIASHTFRGLRDGVHAENAKRGFARHGLQSESLLP